MKRTFAIAAITVAALSACDSSDHTIVAEGPYDPQADLVANAGDVKLPPAIVASHTYRCKDNSIVKIDWLSDGTTTTARVTPDGGSTTTFQPAQAEPDADGEPAQAEETTKELVAGEATLSGDPQAMSINYDGQSCKRG